MKIQTIVVVICICFLITCCEKSNAGQEKSEYDQLCRIYESIVQQPIETGMKELKLAEKIKKQLPVFYEKHYVFISTADRNEKYNLIKQVISSNVGSNWECEVIKTYYHGGYDK